MKKRGKYQKRKARQNKRGKILCIIFFLCAILLFVYGLIQETVNIYDIENNSLNGYTGTCTYEYHRAFGRHRNNYYIFTLDNGEAVYVRNDFMENQAGLSSVTEFSIQYSTIYSNPFLRRYSAASISSADEEISFLNVDRAKGRSIESVQICSAVLLLLAGLLTAYLLLIYTVYGKQRCIRSKKRKKHE